MSPTHEQNLPLPPTRRGQTMVEFALTLPILLLLMFGVIEFARIFQAWITLENAARTAARYAVTGQWDEQSVANALGISVPAGSEEQRKAAVLDYLVPCTEGADEAFTNHWGFDCEPGDDDDQGLRVDMARLPGIVDRARIGAAGLGLKKGDRIVGLDDPVSGNEISSETVTDSEPGWFHVWICSTRPGFVNNKIARYLPSQDRSERICAVNPDGGDLPSGENQYDAGGPGDAVEIIVFFNHPLITPLGLVDYVQLQARRVMINESFRSTRVVNIPPQLALPSDTPKPTPLPSQTPTPSASPTETLIPTKTETPTTTATVTATPLPDCSLVSVSNVRLIDNYLQIVIDNQNTGAPLFISRMEVQWLRHPVFPSMYADRMRIVGRTQFWRGPDYTPPTIADTSDPGWDDDLPDFMLRRVEPNVYTPVRIEFLNGPRVLESYYTVDDFGGTRLYLSRTWGGLNYDPSDDCILELDTAETPTPTDTPTPITLTPTYTPTPICWQYETSFVGFETNGVVHYTIRNGDVVPAYLTSFTINWNTYGRVLPPITLDLVSVGGTNAFDPAAVVMWDSPVDQYTPPVTGTSGGPGWLVDPVIAPGEILDIWFDFDGASGRLDTELGYNDWDFNDTTFVVNFFCYEEAPDVPTPVDTATATTTLTPSFTFTPSVTFTPSRTFTPTYTFTKGPVTATYTPSYTWTPSFTPNLPTMTHTPTFTLPPIEGR